jgi:hypothetical protein
LRVITYYLGIMVLKSLANIGLAARFKYGYKGISIEVMQPSASKTMHIGCHCSAMHGGEGVKRVLLILLETEIF